jgi:hypothetical protein
VEVPILSDTGKSSLIKTKQRFIKASQVKEVMFDSNQSRLIDFE